MGPCLRLSVCETSEFWIHLLWESHYYGKIGSLYLMHRLCLDDQSEKQSALIHS